MLKQRHSTSALSSKTLSRPKFINNKTLQQPHNVSTQSGKQSRTLRNKSKNKSCFIPKHLVQSTESHLVCSNQRTSQQYKSTAKHYSTQHFNPNLSHNLSKNNILHSKLTISENHPSTINQVFSDTLHPAPNMLYSYQPYLSLPTQHIPKPRLSHHNPHIPHHKQPSNTSPINTTSQLVKQRLLQKQVHQMFLHKNKQLTKVLEEMHRFCINVKELKWICEEVTALIQKYNQDMQIFYQQYHASFKPKTDLDNIAHQAQQLLKRFNQLAYLNSSQQHHPLFNFNLLLNPNTFANPQQINNSIFTEHQSIKHQNHKNKSLINQSSNQSPSHPSSSPENPHSWSKLIANLQQQQIPKPFPHQNQPALIPSEQNTKNFTIRTFQITQNNSPFKNKTLNELIRLSELRKTEFDTQNKQNNQLNTNNQHPNPQIDQKNRFAKKQVSSYIESKLMSTEKDPFDSIHLPHFSTKPISDQRTMRQNEKNLRQSQKSFNQTQKNYYENEITLLKKQLDSQDKQNNDYFRKLRQKNLQLEKQNDRLKQKMTLSEEKFSHFERQVYILVQKALNQLLTCGKVNNQAQKTNDKSLNPKTYGKKAYGYESMQVSDIVKTKPIPKSQPYMMIGNKSFFSLVNCLEQVFKLQQSLDQANDHKMEFQPKRHEIKTQRAASRNMPNDKIGEQQKQIINSLNEQVLRLQKVKTALQTQILKLQQQFNSYPPQIDTRKSSNYQLSQMLFAQAFTIQEILQLDDSHQSYTQSYA